MFLDKKQKERHYQSTGHGGPDFKPDTIYCNLGRCAGRKVCRKDNIERHNKKFHSGLNQLPSDSGSANNAA
jgi:hypothetical protein